MTGKLQLLFSVVDRVSPKLGKIAAMNEKIGHTVQKASVSTKVAFGKLRAEADRTSSKINKFFSGIGGKISAALGGITLGAVIGSAVALGANLEQTQVKYETLLGSQTEAAKVMQEMQNFADFTPFNTQEVMDAGQRLLALGVPVGQLQSKMSMLGEISAGTGKDLNELASAYGKMSAAGIVQNEDLNQLMDAGIPIMGELQKLTGKNTLQIKKMAEQGLSIDLINKAMGNLTKEGGLYFGLMDKQSQTVAGRWSTLQSRFENTLAKIGTAMQPFLHQLISVGMVIVDNMIPALKSVRDMGLQVMDFVSRYAVIIGAIAAGMIAYKAVTLATVAVTKIWTGIQWALNAAMNANPIGLIIGLIVGVIAAIGIAYMKFEAFRGVLHGVWEAFKEYFGRIGKLASAVGQIMIGAVTFDKDRVMQGIEGLKSAVGGAGTAIAAKFAEGYDKGVASKVELPGALKNLMPGNAKAVTPGATDSGQAAPGGATQPTASGGGSSPSSIGNNISAGGSKPTNINVNLGKFMDNLVIQSQTVPEGAGRMRDIIEEELLRLLNGINQMAT